MDSLRQLQFKMNIKILVEVDVLTSSELSLEVELSLQMEICANSKTRPMVISPMTLIIPKDTSKIVESKYNLYFLTQWYRDRREGDRREGDRRPRGGLSFGGRRRRGGRDRRIIIQIQNNVPCNCMRTFEKPQFKGRSQDLCPGGNPNFNFNPQSWNPQPSTQSQTLKPQPQTINH